MQVNEKTHLIMKIQINLISTLQCNLKNRFAGIYIINNAGYISQENHSTLL